AGAPFRTRYLLLEPAAALSSKDPSARAYLSGAMMSDPDEHVRAQAARSLRDPRQLSVELRRLLDDPAVRVREAALVALRASGAEEARAAIAYRLEHDAWPLVRSAAARALAGLRPGPEADGALGDALGDDSGEVRRAALWA